jgi:hypothetical protein
VQAVHRLIIAMMSNDEQTIRVTIKPHADAAVLWQGVAAPADAVALARAELDKNPCRIIAVGETLTLPGNRKFQLMADMVDDDRELVMPRIGGTEGPIPLWVERESGDWKVDAGPLIKIRMAAKKKMAEAK